MRARSMIATVSAAILMSAVLAAVATPAQAIPEDCDAPITSVVFLEPGVDYYEGTSEAEEIHGGDGHDTIYGYGGADVLIGGEGSDLLIGGDCPDDMRGNGGPDQMAGGPGDDVFDGGVGHDQCSDVRDPAIVYFVNWEPC